MNKLIRVCELLLLRASGALSTLIFSYMLMNYYSTEASAKYFFLFSLITITSYISRVGSDNYLTKTYASPTEKITEMDSAIISLIILALIFSSIFSVLLFAYGEDGIICANFFIINFFYSLIQAKGRVLSGSGKPKLSIIAINGLLPIVTLVISLIFIFLYKETDKNSAVYILSISTIVTFIGIGGVDIKKFNILQGIRIIIDGSRVFFITGFIGIFTYWGGQLLTGLIFEDSDINALAVIQRVVGFISLFALSISIYISPQIVKYYESKNNYKVKELIVFSNRVMFGVIFIFIVAVHFYGTILLGFFNISPEYYKVLFLASIGQVFIGLSSGAIQTLNMTGNEVITRKCVVYSSLVFIFGLFMAYIFDNFYIVIISSLAAWITQSMLSIVYLKKLFGYWGCSLKVN